MADLLCDGSASKTHDAGRDGLCRWCRQRLGPPVPRPRQFNRVRSNLDAAYRYHYDPDWGSSRDDMQEIP